MPTPTIKGSISLSTEELERAFKRAETMGRQAADNLAKSFVVAGAKIASVGAVVDKAVSMAKGVAAGIAQAYELGGALAQASTRTGVLASQLAVLNQAAKTVGIGDLSREVNLMQRNLEAAARTGKGPAAQALAALGVNVGALLRQQPAEQMQALGRAINGVADPAARTATAMAVFGRAGAELLPLFENEGAIDQAAQTLGRQASILGDNAQVFRRVAELLESSGTKVQGFFVGAAASLEGTLLPLLERFDKVDLAGIGKQFGDGIRQGVDLLVGAFGNQQVLAQLIGDGLDLGIRQGGNVLIAVFKSGIEFLSDGLMALWGGMGQVITATLLDAFKSPVATVQASLEALLQSRDPNAQNPDRLRELTERRDRQQGYVDHPETVPWDVRLVNRVAGKTPQDDLAGLNKQIADEQAKPKQETADEIYARIMREGPRFGLGEGQTSQGLRESGMSHIHEGVNKAAEKFSAMKVTDELGAAASGRVFGQDVAQAQRLGKPIVDKIAALPSPVVQPGYAGAGTPVGPNYARQLRELYGTEEANRMMYPKASAAMLNLQQRAPVSGARRAELAQLFGSEFVQKKMLTDDGKLRPEYDHYGTGTQGGVRPSISYGVGTGTSLDLEPAAARGNAWTGANDAFAGFTKQDWTNYRGTSGNGYGGHTSLTGGGLGGGAYGRRTNVLTQLSGRVGGSGDPAADTAKHTAAMSSKMDKLVSVWTGGNSGGSGGGGATVTG